MEGKFGEAAPFWERLQIEGRGVGKKKGRGIEKRQSRTENHCKEMLVLKPRERGVDDGDQKTRVGFVRGPSIQGVSMENGKKNRGRGCRKA